MNGNPLDLVFIIIILCFTILAAVHGFVREVFGKAAFVVAVLAAVVFMNSLVPMFLPSVHNAILASIISFVVIFVAVFLLIKILQEIFAKLFSIPILSSLNHALGFLFGIVEGFAVVCFIMFIFMVQPWFDTVTIFSGSIFYDLLYPVISVTRESIIRMDA